MATVKQKHANESFDALLRRFKKAVDNENILKEYRDHEFYETPSSKRKRAKASARKRTEKQRTSNVLPERKY